MASVRDSVSFLHAFICSVLNGRNYKFIIVNTPLNSFYHFNIGNLSNKAAMNSE